MKRLLTILITIFVFSMTVSAQQVQQPVSPASPPQPPHQNVPEAPPPPALNSELTYKIVDAANNTFGYDVFSDSKLMIHQPSIPAMPGNDGFKSREDAAKVAELVIQKIRNGEMPPTVTVEELKSLKVIPE